MKAAPNPEMPGLRVLHEQRAKAELARTAVAFPGSDVVRWRGSLIPDVAVVKGLPGPSEASGGAAVSGADGDAIAKALERLGNDPGQVFFTLSRPTSTMSDADCAERLRAQLEAVDAPLIVALDRVAADDVRRAFDLEEFVPGALVRSRGRRFVSCDGLEESLDDKQRKQVVWRQLSAAVPLPPVF